MAIRSLRDIWVDANFKETQLRDLRIGQRVELQVDMYGGKRKFEGRISGFTMGTGSTLALLPAQNATGNFVKVVQRLPVRIDVVDYDPDKAPLFVGLSVEPSVDIRRAPTGPNAGKFLQESIQPDSPPAPSRPSHERRLVRGLPLARRGSATRSSTRGSSRSRWSCRPSWRCSIPRSRTWRCATSQAGCPRRSPIASGSSPAISRPMRSSCRSPAGSRCGSGRRNYFLWSIAVFTLASVLCGMATSLNS